MNTEALGLVVSFWYNNDMIIKSELDMLSLGQHFAQHLTPPAVFELIGDVGVGKTTFTRGLAAALGVEDPLTSPSFTISKRYYFQNGQKSGSLIHYDFYRLPDPGIMRDELAEALADPDNIIVVEWGGDVADLLPESKYRLEFQLNADGTRTINLNQPALQCLQGHKSSKGESA